MQLVILKCSGRSAHAVQIQEVLTKHGCDIMVRLGLHEVSSDECSNDGLIILQVKNDQNVVNSLTADLSGIEGVTVKTVSL